MVARRGPGVTMNWTPSSSPLLPTAALKGRRGIFHSAPAPSPPRRAFRPAQRGGTAAPGPVTRPAPTAPAPPYLCRPPTLHSPQRGPPQLTFKSHLTTLIGRSRPARRLSLARSRPSVDGLSRNPGAGCLLVARLDPHWLRWASPPPALAAHWPARCGRRGLPWGGEPFPWCPARCGVVAVRWRRGLAGGPASSGISSWGRGPACGALPPHGDSGAGWGARGPRNRPPGGQAGLCPYLSAASWGTESRVYTGLKRPGAVPSLCCPCILSCICIVPALLGWAGSNAIRTCKAICSGFVHKNRQNRNADMLMKRPATWWHCKNVDGIWEKSGVKEETAEQQAWG